MGLPKTALLFSLISFISWVLFFLSFNETEIAADIFK